LSLSQYFLPFSFFLFAFVMILSNIYNKVLAESPSFSLQQFMGKYKDWYDLKNSRPFFRSEVTNPLMDLTDILSVNYFSDGKTLHAIFWLASPFDHTNITANIISYGALVDADFDETTGIQGADFSISINWNNTSKNWYKSFEGLETPNKFINAGDRRVLNTTSNYQGFYDPKHRYVLLDIDLARMLFPHKYKILFFTQYRDDKFWVIDSTDWMAIPFPQLAISLSPNPVFLSPGGQTNIELRLNESTGYQSNVHLYTDQIGDVSVKFIPDNITIPSYGLASSRLIIRASDIAEPGQQITLPILAKLTIPGQAIFKISLPGSNTISSCSPTTPPSVCIPQSTNQSVIQQSSLAIRIMTFEEQLNNFVNLFNPLTSIITTSTTIIGIITGYIFARGRSKK
jgi:hypothetical protein